MRCDAGFQSRLGFTYMHDDDPSMHAGAGLVTGEYSKTTRHICQPRVRMLPWTGSNKSTMTSPPAAARYDMIATAY